MATRLLLIRHAHIDTDARLCGSLDVPLSPSGLAQLRAMLARPPAHPPPDVLYTSSLRRASQVAVVMGETWALNPIRADWAREIHCGQMEGLPLDRLEQRFPGLWIRNQAQLDDDFSWPGGESYVSFRARVLEGVRTLARLHRHRRVAVVTHAGVISQIIGVIHRRRAAVWSKDRPDPLSATEVTCTTDGPVAVVTYNERDWY